MLPGATRRLLSLAIFVLAAVLLPVSVSANNHTRHVLLLNSYHQNMTWTKDIVQAVEDELAPERNDLILHTEFMDSKRFHSAEYFRSLFEFYRQKYRQTQFSLILSSDNNAYDFLRQYRDTLFPGVPVAFCGVNYFREEQLAGLRGFTGVEEVFDAAATLRIALRNHPDTRKVLIVNDYLKSGRASEQAIRQQLAGFKDRLAFEYVENLTLAELSAKVSSLEPGSIVLFGVYYADRDGRYITFERIGSLLASSSRVPVYCLFEFNIGQGVVGGNVISGYAQGQRMAAIGKRLLAGVAAEQIPVVRTGTNRNIFDYQQLKRFRIDASRLPDGAQIVNRPFSFYQQYALLIWLVVGFVSLLLLLILVLLLSIQRRRVAERSLRESEQKFRTLYDRSYEFIGLMTPDGTLIDANQTSIAFSGLSRDELLNRKFWDTVWWQHSETERKKLQQAVRKAATGKTVQFETNHLAADGELRTVDFSLTPLFDEAGRVDLLIPEGRDITERKRMEQKLRESEDRLRELIEHSPIGLVLCSLDGELLSVNAAYAEILGYRATELLHLNYAQLTPERYAEAELQQLMQLKRAGRCGPYEKELRHKDGHLVPVRVNSMLVKRNGREMIWSSVEDITALRVAEADREELAEQLRQSQKMEAIGTLAGGVAHDFNNILSAILGYTELAMRNANLNDKGREYLRNIYSAGNRAKELVKQILMFSRKGEKKREVVRIHEVVLEAVKLLRKTIPTTVAIKVDVDVNTGTVLADPTQIHQVVMNLCTNAYHAMPDASGEIRIALQAQDVDPMMAARYPNLRPGRYAQLSVADNGVGMPAEVLARIFEPFYTTKKQGEGTGMGLAVVHGIVQSHDGAIGVESVYQHGTTFLVFLPLAEEGHEQSAAQGQEQPLPRGNERILWVDDEAMLVELGRELLEPLGYRVTATTSATEALRIFRADPQAFDLIVTDQTMPEMTGDMLAKQVVLLRPELPILICTGHSAVLDAEKARAIGVRALLMKPLESRQLIQEVRAALDNTNR